MIFLSLMIRAPSIFKSQYSGDEYVRKSSSTINLNLSFYSVTINLKFPVKFLTDTLISETFVPSFKM